MAIPNPPSNLAAVAASASRIDLTWQDNSADEDNFELERSPNGTTGWTLINSPAANVTTYANTGLTTNTEYFYRIRAVNLDGNSAYSATASALTLNPGRAPLAPRMYLWQPQVVFAARVNQTAAAEYPVFHVVYDGVTTGAYTDISPGMTLLLGSAAGLDDYGRQRVRAVNGDGATAIVVWVGRSSRGTHDGELTIVDNAYITVWDERRVWAKIPFIDSAGEIFKDGSLAVGDRTTTPPPVAVMGAGYAGTIDAGTSVITVSFNGQGSYTTAAGATIASYLWAIGDGTLTGGALTDDAITATFPAGQRYVSLTVTDSNGNSHTTYRPVYARDPAADTSFDAFEIAGHRIHEGGQTVSVRILDDMPQVTYPDGTVVLMWLAESAGSGDRNHMLIVGWLDRDDSGMVATRHGLQRDTVLTVLDVAGWLAQLPGFAQSIADDLSRDTALTPAITWSYMTAPNLDKYMHFLLHWHSNADDVADLILSGDGTDYPFTLWSSDGDSLWNQVDRVARAFVPDRVLTCDRGGIIRVVPDPMLANPADRTAVVQDAIDENEWSDIRFSYQRAPRVHWLRGGAMLAVAWASLPLDGAGAKYIPTVASIAPGDTPGQGVGALTQGEQLAISQAALNDATGHRYARANAPVGPVSVTLLQDDSSAGVVLPWATLEPALKEWVTLTVSAATAARRGLTWTTIRALIKEINIRYAATRAGLARTLVLTLELETVGAAGATVVKPVDIPAVGVDLDPVVFVPPAFGDPGMFYGDINAYVAWDKTHIGRTWDLQATTPTYTNISGSIDGDILDCQYFMPSATTVGAWLLTTTGVWVCQDLMATTPVWSEVLAVETVQAADETPSDGTVGFANMTHYWSQPGHLCVTTEPKGTPINPASYLHAYFWQTEDYGQNWTQVDMSSFTYTSDSITRCYSYSGQNGMACFRSSPVIWCLRNTSRTGTSDGRTAVFKSVDGGLTWSKEHEFLNWSNSGSEGSILHPFPNIDSPSYIVRTFGNSPGALDIQLWRSTDAWATATQITTLPASHAGGHGFGNVIQRANQHTFDDDHIINILRIADTNGDLYESYDRGATWALLANLNNSTTTPNGWPPDVSQWVTIDSTNTPRIQLTLNNFSSFADKTGDIVTAFGSWATGGQAGGFALPRIAPNV